LPPALYRPKGRFVF
jgi:hypothetical protein